LKWTGTEKPGCPGATTHRRYFERIFRGEYKALDVEIEERFKATAEVELNLFTKHRKLRRSRDH
jgi:hypothetical protein